MLNGAFTNDVCLKSATGLWNVGFQPVIDVCRTSKNTSNKRRFPTSPRQFTTRLPDVGSTFIASWVPI